MQVKRYEVATISEAVGKIKKDLGPDAIVLSARKIRSGKDQAFEVMAALDQNHAASKVSTSVLHTPQKNVATTNPEDSLTLLRGEIQEIKSALSNLGTEQSLKRELAEMKEAMNQFFDVLGMRKGRAPMDTGRKLYLHLIGSGFSRAAACRIVEAVNSEALDPMKMTNEAAFAAARNFISKSLPRPRLVDEEKRVKMFIGPTGVGKTTTLAKLAARYSMIKKMKVGLITTDNFRIAAAQQLGTYARIMGLRMETASTPETLSAALKCFSGEDVILVDTPGRATPDQSAFRDLEKTLSAQDIETNLLISATSSDDYLQNLIGQYAAFRIHRLIVTKVDESVRFGSLFDVVSRAGSPVSYLTCGQNVPQDIEEATPLSMAELMIGTMQDVKDAAKTGLSS
ncbi:MAG: flagellar biosynthesis protein FlhF [Smithellaceae bacterium]